MMIMIIMRDLTEGKGKERKGSGLCDSDSNHEIGEIGGRKEKNRDDSGDKTYECRLTLCVSTWDGKTSVSISTTEANGKCFIRHVENVSLMS